MDELEALLEGVKKYGATCEGYGRVKTLNDRSGMAYWQNRCNEAYDRVRVGAALMATVAPEPDWLEREILNGLLPALDVALAVGAAPAAVERWRRGINELVAGYKRQAEKNNDD